MALHSSLLYILPVLHCLRCDAFGFFCFLAGVRRKLLKRFHTKFDGKGKGKVKVHKLDKRLFIVNHHRRSAQVWHVFSRDFSFTCTCTHTFIRNRNEPYLPLPSQL